MSAVAPGTISVPVAFGCTTREYTICCFTMFPVCTVLLLRLGPDKTVQLSKRGRTNCSIDTLSDSYSICKTSFFPKVVAETFVTKVWANVVLEKSRTIISIYRGNKFIFAYGKSTE